MTGLNVRPPSFEPSIATAAPLGNSGGPGGEGTMRQPRSAMESTKTRSQCWAAMFWFGQRISINCGPPRASKMVSSAEVPCKPTQGGIASGKVSPFHGKPDNGSNSS